MDQVSEFLQNASRFDPEHFVNVLPDGRTWIWMDPNIAHGAETRERSVGNALESERVYVARWVHGQEHIPFDQCLSPEELQVYLRRLNGY